MAAIVASIERLPAGPPVQVYDITVAGTHRYYANGILVSNSKRLGMLNVNALLGHGAVGVLADATSVRGGRNDEFWLQMLRGHTPPEPGVPQVYKKFLAELQASGVRVIHDGPRLHVMGLTRDDVNKLAGDRQLTSAGTVRVGTMEPVPGGLFDRVRTGGHGGQQWSAMPLAERMPAPIMEEPIRRLLGLTEQKFRDVLAGQQPLGDFGTGPQAFVKAFENYDVAAELKQARSGLQASSAAARENARRKLGLLKGMEKYELHPRDFLYDQVPVLPPVFRPVGSLPDGTPLVSDANYLYADLFKANQNLQQVSARAGAEAAGPERLAVYDAFKAVTGLGDPVGRKSRDKNVRGILSRVWGSSPKFSSMQRSLLSTTVDNVGRGVIVPDPDLDMDELGVPENMAFEQYGRFVARRLVRGGMSPVDAVREVRDRSQRARTALLAEMEERPVFMDRAPVLHKFGILGFRPKLVAGHVVRIPPLVVKGFGADFDGDQVQVHVPTTAAGVRDVWQMLPSKNLLAASDFTSAMHKPSQQYQAGLYRASSARSTKPTRTFATTADVLRALRSGEIAADDPVHILDPERKDSER